MLKSPAVIKFVEIVFAYSEDVSKVVNRELTVRVAAFRMPEDIDSVYTVSAASVDARVELVKVEYVFAVSIFAI